MADQLTRNIALTADLADFIAEIDAAGEFTSVSEYFRHLIREDRERRNQRAIDLLLIEGLNSGESKTVDSLFWTQKKKDLLRTVEQKSKKKNGSNGASKNNARSG